MARKTAEKAHPLRPRGLRHLALKAHDLRATTRFYTEILGLEVAFRHRGMIFLRSPGGDDVLNFIETTTPIDPEAGGFDHFGLHFTRAEWKKISEALERAEVPIVGRRGRWSVYIQDPNGYTIELYAD